LKLKNEKVEFPFFPLPSLCFFVGARENQKSPPLIFGFIDWTVEPKTIIRTTTATRTTTIESKIQSKKKILGLGFGHNRERREVAKSFAQ
jgi:hypothetical protein